MRKDELRRLTRLQRLDESKKLEIRGRSTMSKEELVEAVAGGAKRPEAKTEEPKRTARPKAETKPPTPSRPVAARGRKPAAAAETPQDPPPPDRPTAARPEPPPAAAPAEDRTRGAKGPAPAAPPRPPKEGGEEEEDGQNWNSVSLGRDPNYGRFLSPGSIPPRPGAPPRRGGPPNGGPRPIGESLSERSERGRMRATERSYGARDDLRRTGDARRQSGYTPRYTRPADERGDRAGRPRGDANRPGRDARGEGPRPRHDARHEARPETRPDSRPETRPDSRPDARPGHDRRGNDRTGAGGRHDARRTRTGPVGRVGPPSGLQDDAEIGVESRAEMILEAPRTPRETMATAGFPGRERQSPEAAPSVRPAASTPGAPGAPGSLPRHYGIDRCRLMVRDPLCVHAYWEIRGETLDRARGDLGDEWEGNRRILRVHGIPISGDVNEPAADFFDLDVADGDSSLYVPVPRSNRGYRVDVGVVTKAGLFYPLASSNTVITPRNGVSLNQTESWASPPASPEGAPTAAPGPVPSAEPTPAPPVPASAPIEAAGVSGALRADFSGAGRMAVVESREVLFESGRGLIPPGPGIPPGAEAPTSPEGGGFPTPAKRREGAFWFVLNTELVVYGATEPDAKVTLQGKPVRLRPDGTFSLRFQLPDGTQELRAEAASADGRFARTITPTVTRTTTSEQTNTKEDAET